MNMSYCRFENTYNGLKDCYSALMDGALEEEASSEYEEWSKINLIKLCKTIADEFGNQEEDQNDANRN